MQEDFPVIDDEDETESDTWQIATTINCPTEDLSKTEEDENASNPETDDGENNGQQ